jgi:hypothetical protein
MRKYDNAYHIIYLSELGLQHYWIDNKEDAEKNIADLLSQQPELSITVIFGKFVDFDSQEVKTFRVKLS